MWYLLNRSKKLLYGPLQCERYCFRCLKTITMQSIRCNVMRPYFCIIVLGNCGSWSLIRLLGLFCAWKKLSLWNRESEKANYCRFWAIFGQIWVNMILKSKLASKLCYTTVVTFWQCLFFRKHDLHRYLVHSLIPWQINKSWTCTTSNNLVSKQRRLFHRGWKNYSKLLEKLSQLIT